MFLGTLNLWLDFHTVALLNTNTKAAPTKNQCGMSMSFMCASVLLLPQPTYLSDCVTVICGLSLALAAQLRFRRTRILDGCVRNSRRQSLDWRGEDGIQFFISLTGIAAKYRCGG